MPPIWIGVFGFVGLMALLALRMPVGLAMILVSTIGQAVLLRPEAALARLGLDTFSIITNASLSVIPLFVLMGFFLANAGLGSDLYDFAATLLRRLRGALAIATIGASAMFSAVCGSAVATTLTMSVVTVPEMRRHRYDDRLAAGAAAVGGTLGILIPPSGILVLYGFLTEESIGRVLIAGILPGIMTALMLMITAHLVARFRPSWAPAVAARHSVWRAGSLEAVLSVPIIFGLSMGGIYAGVFTPTEAAAVAAFLALAFGVASRRLGRSGFVSAVSQVVRLTASLFIMLIGGTMFGFFLSLTKLPITLASFVSQLDVPAPLIVAAVFAIYFVLGALMEEIAILVIMTPIVYPVVVNGLGYDGVWFGVLSIMMLLTGLLTPPVGLLSFVTSSATGIPLGKVYSGVTPFWLTLILANALVIMFPEIALVLPRLMK